MYKRPWSLIVLAIFHLVSPIFNIALNAVYLNAPLGKYFTSAMTLKYLTVNWPILVAPFVCGIAIYACKKWSFFVYLLSLSMLFFFSYQGYLSKSETLGIFPMIAVYAVNILVVAYFLVPEVRQIYFNPRLRWWETKPRYRSDYNCEFSLGSGTTQGHIGNFSEGGLFIKSDDFPEDNSIVTITFPANGEEQSFQGRAILHKHQNAVGFGVEFVSDSAQTKRAKKLAKTLHDDGMRIESRYARHESDSFGIWLKTLFTTGKGLFPKKNS